MRLALTNPRRSILASVSLAAIVVGGPRLLAGQPHTPPRLLDPDFGTGGRVTTEVASGAERAFAVAIQADGRIVTAGEAGGDFALVRYLPDGSLDASFGGDGIVTTDIGVFDKAFAVVIQGDGRIVAAGGTAPGGFCCQFALARYHPDGSLDTSFDGDGKVTTVFGGSTEAFSVALQADGKIVAAGGTFSPFADEFALARYNTDGSLDTSFDGDGKLTTDFGGASDAASGVVIQADGKIVAAGAGGPQNDFALARYNANGSLDTSFDGDGRLTTDFGGFDRASDVVLQPDGKILAAGMGQERFAVARYGPNGALDPGFGGDGTVTTIFTGQNLEAAAGLALEGDGTIAAAGFVFVEFDREFALARFHPDGALAGRGRVIVGFGPLSNDGAEAVAIQADGKTVLAGGAGPCTPPCQFAVARFLPFPSR